MYNILICDDEQDIVNALKIYLSGGDYCLFEASNGREALEVVEKNDINLILMDIMMPQLDGIAATTEVYASGRQAALRAGPGLLGRVLDAHGDILNRSTVDYGTPPAS